MLVLITFIYLVLTVASGNAGASCSLNNGMTDEVRQMFVDKHNQYRSLVAKGLAVNPIGGFAPKAARMLKVNTKPPFLFHAKILKELAGFHVFRDLTLHEEL
ncbi:hypothetical protein TELCIR_17552 [Teladorsagia circumcincta]|uniref:SCP domain-containing protein n=1 Tax=Teladorsagia circumcincta TaxID=45464 RepID=A0A2G9TUK6_TELCI|nr:hypothetical protein TELCIR_17552 [Teladorsagia circumcincta]